MTPVISPWVFYAISVVDGLKSMAMIGATLTVAAATIFSISALSELDCEGEVTDASKELIKRCIIAFAAFLAFLIFIPSSNTITKMIVAQNVTYERVEVATDTVQEVYEDFMELLEEESER